jgi:type I restriction enzyme S subunit
MLQKVHSSPTIQHVPLAKLVLDVSTRSPGTKPNETFTYVDLSAVDQERKAIIGARVLVGSEAPSRARQVICTDDVLVSTVRPNLNGVAQVPEDYDDAIASTGFCVLRPNVKLLDPVFLFHWVRSPAFVAEMVRRATGASYPAVSDRIVQQSLIPYPPLSEQRRIAAILDQADALRTKRREALAKLDEMAQAIFVEMFGDLQTNTREWPTLPCAELCQRINVGVVIKPASYYCETGVPAIRGTNIRPHGIDLSDIVYFSKRDSDGPLSKSRLWEGDLVIVRTGQPGLTAIVPPQLHGANAIDVIIATPKTERINPIFMRELLNSEGGKQVVLKHSRGQIQQHFNVGSLASAELIVPPIALQGQFAERLETISTLRLSALSSSKKIETFFSSLQHRAFSGDL